VFEYKKRTLDIQFEKVPKEAELKAQFTKESAARIAAETKAIETGLKVEELERTVERLTRENKGLEEQLIELAEAHQNSMNQRDFIPPQVQYYAAPPMPAAPVNPYAAPSDDDYHQAPYASSSWSGLPKAQELKPGAPNPFSFASI
jgi:hypothetical protein